MDCTSYQEHAALTAVYPRPIIEGRSAQIYVPEDIVNAAAIVPIMYCALGLAGESGEVAEQVKKSWRNNMKISDERREKVKDELGDCLWYIAQLATELEMTLGDIAQQNIDKLQARQAKSQLKERND